MINTKSLRFQLVVSYGGVLLVFALLLCTGVFFLVRAYLVRSLVDRQAGRVTQIQGILDRWTKQSQAADLRNEIETAFAPRANGRFIRIFKNGSELYSSEEINVAEAGIRNASVQRLTTKDGREILTFTKTVQFGEHSFTIQSGVSTEQMRTVLWQLLLFMILGSPLLVAFAVLGGHNLVKRALYPVIEMAQKAEKISVENLSERLPVPQTGDELERLSSSLNHLLNRLDESLQHSQRFVADASHELRTPLTILQGEMESLLHGKVSPGEMDRVIGNLLEETERLGRIVEALLALSQLDTGEAQRERSEVDLGELATSTSEQMALLAEDKKISMSCLISERVFVWGDYSRLKQIVVNLLDNAIKYTQENGSIMLHVRAEGTQAVLEVIDTGIGIPPEALSQIFKRFFRVDKARSRDLGGAGLGLAIAKSICDAHGGTIEAQSRFGEGSCFRVSFSLYRCEPKAEVQEPLKTGFIPTRARLG